MAVSLAVRHISKAKGRGVVARRAFAAGELIEVCHLIAFVPVGTFPPHEWILGAGRGRRATVFTGHAHLYNHSSTPNVSIRYDSRGRVLRVVALLAIEPGDELCMDYGPHAPVSGSRATRKP